MTNNRTPSVETRPRQLMTLTNVKPRPHKMLQHARSGHNDQRTDEQTLVRRGRSFVFRGACGARSKRADPAKMLEPASSGLGSRQLQRSLPPIMAAMRASRLRVCRRLRDGRNLERGVGRGRVAARQGGTCVVVGQGVFRAGVGGHGRGLLLRLVEVLQAAEAVVGTTVPAIPGEEGGGRGVRESRGVGRDC